MFLGVVADSAPPLEDGLLSDVSSDLALFPPTDSTLFDCLAALLAVLFFVLPLFSALFSAGEGLEKGDDQKDPDPPQVELLSPDVLADLGVEVAAAAVLGVLDLTFCCEASLGGFDCSALEDDCDWLVSCATVCDFVEVEEGVEDGVVKFDGST